VAAVCVFCASSDATDPRYREMARELGVGLGQRGHTLVSGGGRVGMMGTVAAGARSAGARTVGVIPQCLVDREIADRSADELIITKDMADRKSVLLARSDGFIVLPGGIGTLDELFEIWTTASLDLHDKPVVLVDADGFYAGLLHWLRALVPSGFLHAEAMARLHVVESVPAALDTFGGPTG
jgi:uncharacterized protein (TIGR00730 family)